MSKKIRPNVLRIQNGISMESIQKAQQVLRAFSQHLEKLGSVQRAAAEAAAATGTHAETPH